jgi:GDP-L-fucose synthase
VVETQAAAALDRGAKFYVARHRGRVGLAIWRHLQAQVFPSLVAGTTPTNLYGPNDNFNLRSSRVLPALICRFREAKGGNASEVVLSLQSGTPGREFFHVEDVAAPSLFLLEKYDAPEAIKIGVGEDLMIRELAEIVAEVIGYEGELVEDPSKPEGTPRKLLDVTRFNDLRWKFNDLRWKATVSLRAGVVSKYRWFVKHRAEIRG